eukprot:TRINITY_DN60437_c0_g1_i1.p1 TRINITY_DN60437_c0_g1~~TRINITY_DN60437_c0_g1_i1.p1  ORF type:complete len:326 (+),score=55.90 TRINITY_DN60437_c0_g1_i1:3-980(+)
MEQPKSRKSMEGTSASVEKSSLDLQATAQNARNPSIDLPNKLDEVMELLDFARRKPLGWDSDVIFADDYIVVHISDLYTALNPVFLKEQGIAIVVNTIGPPDLVDENAGRWGAKSHWKTDCKETKEEWSRNSANRWEWEHTTKNKDPSDIASQQIRRGVGGEERARAIEEYMAAGSEVFEQFYEPRGVEKYIEEASADNASYNMVPHMKSINKQLRDFLVEELKGRQLQDTGKKCRTNILFHCYLGRNRSGSLACAFVFWWRNRVALEGKRSFGESDQTASLVPMADVIQRAAAARSEILTKNGGTYKEYVRQLLEYEAELTRSL